MPRDNPARSAQGGDVPGFRKTDPDLGSGEPIEVAEASYDPGYSLTTTLSDGGVVVNPADLLRGYCSYGKVIGEK